MLVVIKMRSTEKMMGKKVVGKLSTGKFCSVYFFVHESPKEATDLA
jgi:hypothetical protein